MGLFQNSVELTRNLRSRNLFVIATGRRGSRAWPASMPPTGTGGLDRQYDYLIKLLLIGDSGEYRRWPLPSCRQPCFRKAHLHTGAHPRWTTAMTAAVLWPVCRCGQVRHPDAVRRRLIHHELYHNYWVSLPHTNQIPSKPQHRATFGSDTP